MNMLNITKIRLAKMNMTDWEIFLVAESNAGIEKNIFLKSCQNGLPEAESDAYTLNNREFGGGLIVETQYFPPSSVIAL